MKKIIFYTLIFLVILLLASATFLSLVGYETSKFNNLIEKTLKEKEPNADINISNIKIKLDLKNFNLFLRINYPELNYQNVNIPISSIKLYFDLFSILKSDFLLQRAIIKLDKFSIKEIKKLAVRIKPSNFKSYLLNNVSKGNIKKSDIDLVFFKDLKIKKYKIEGEVKKISVKINNHLFLKNTNFNFFLDEDLLSINSFNGNYEDINIRDGFVNVDREKEMNISGSFKSSLDISTLRKYQKLFNSFPENIENIKLNASVSNKFDLKLSNTLKILDYNFFMNGSIADFRFNFKNKINSKFLENYVDEIVTKTISLDVNLNAKKKNYLLLNGLYKTNNSEFKKFKIKNDLKKTNSNYDINFDLGEQINIEALNFKTNPKKKGNIKSRFNIGSKKINLNQFIFEEDKNKIEVKNLKILNKSFHKLDDINIVTFNDGIENNNFRISFRDKILIKGKKYDSSYLLKQLSGKKHNFLEKINKKIEIKFENIITKSSVPLYNFNLLGVIEKGKFIKINSKSEFSDNKYLDISLDKDGENKKILEIYSDLPKALLSDFKFFEGIKDGKLLYTSVISETSSKSKLLIEDFKILKAPKFATLLTLADLGGVADLLSGDGISFDLLEVDLLDDDNTTTINEVLAIGPSISVLMDGYVEKKTKLVSLRGTMVPAKNLNKLISKIPVVGDILVGKKLGEGIFGISFKIKGPPGKLKTSVNPVKTLTPRFITRILERKKTK